MALDHFLNELTALLERAQDLKANPPPGKPEENTKGKLLTPFLEALGYGPDERTFEGIIKTLTSEWVDYFLLPEARKAPWLMLEAKSFWDGNIWQNNKEQVLRYMRDYSLMVAGDAPIGWIVLTNFAEWHVLRLNDREPFLSFSAQELGDPNFAQQVYDALARENVPRDRLLSRYRESQRDKLGERFLRDLKVWRVILANGIRQEQPELTLEEIRQASHTILLRFLFMRLLENYGRERYYSLGTLYDMWSKTFQSLPFIQSLQAKFRDTWASYNTELFAERWEDRLNIPNEFLELLILPDAVPDPAIVPLLEGQILGYRSVYNYDFSTLTQDILGTAYEQFLAHELVESEGVIRVRDNQETRKKEGVFYTPGFVVRHIVKRVLEPQVKPHLEEALAKLAEGEYEAAFAAASRILDARVVDPACGSGSFLLGAFEYLTDALETYNRAAQDAYQQGWAENGGDLFSSPTVPPKTVSYPHERVLTHCLYGVDLDPQAVGLAKLSLWTQLLRTHPGHYGKRGAPHAQLPALTLNIRSGNSLIDALQPAPQALAAHAEALTQAAALARRAKDVDADAPARSTALKALEETIAEVNAALLPNLLPFFADNDTLRRAIQSSGQEDDDATIEAVRHYLITGSKPKVIQDWGDKTLAEILEALRKEAAALEDVRTKRPFNWQVEFPDVFDPELPEEKRGFSVVIGNPPYFNVDATFGRGALELNWLRYAYADITTDKTDILFYFFARGYEVLRQGGELSFIVSRSFLQGDKSAKLRKFLAAKTTLLGFLDFLGHKVFKAGIATTIVHWRKGEAPEGHELTMDYVMDFDAVKAQLEQGHTPTTGVAQVKVEQESLNEDRWVLSPYKDIFDKIDAAGVKLHESGWGFFLKGIDTGLDNVFEGDFLNMKPPFPQEWLRSRVKISGIFPFGWKPPDSQILYTPRNTAWESLPEVIRAYLEKHRNSLEERSGVRRGDNAWYEIHWPREGTHGGKPYTLFSPKLFFPRRASYNRFAVDETGEIGFKSDVAAFIYSPEAGKSANLHALCALLNSKVLNFRYRALGGLGKLTGKGMFEYFENQVGDLPIPKLSKDDEKQLGELGRRAHALFRQRYELVEAYRRVLGSQPYRETAFWAYHDPAGDYGHLVSFESSDPNRAGHLLGLRAEATETGYRLWGEVTEEEDWREGEREWVVLAEVAVSHAALRRMLLFRVHYLTEFDEGFKRKQKFTQSATDNVLRAAFTALSAPVYDSDPTRNLRVLDNLEKRVTESEPLETVMLAFARTEAEIDDVAFRLYGVEAYRAEIEAALQVVL